MYKKKRPKHPRPMTKFHITLFVLLSTSLTLKTQMWQIVNDLHGLHTHSYNGSDQIEDVSRSGIFVGVVLDSGLLVHRHLVLIDNPSEGGASVHDISERISRDVLDCHMLVVDQLSLVRDELHLRHLQEAAVGKQDIRRNIRSDCQFLISGNALVAQMQR